MTTAFMSQDHPTAAPAANHQISAEQALRHLDRRSYAVLASTSDAGRSHSAGILYARSGRHLYFSTMRSSRKARNIANNPSVGLTVPVRRVPIGGPPSAIMFQAKAEVLDVSNPSLLEAVATGDLKAITGHGELELPGGCFVRIELPTRLLTYGLGMSLLSLIRDPLSAGGFVELQF